MLFIDINDDFASEVSPFSIQLPLPPDSAV